MLKATIRERRGALASLVVVLLALSACHRDQAEPTTPPSTEEVGDQSQAQAPRPTFSEAQLAAEREAREALEQLGPAGRLGARIIAEADLGLAQWEMGPSKREAAIASFLRAAELADQGRPPEETLQAKLERYRLFAGPELPLDELVDAIAKARFHVAEQSFEAFQAVPLPSFKGGPRLSVEVQRWWTERQGQAKAREWREMLQYLSEEERRAQIGSVQFQHYVTTEFQAWMKRADDLRAQAEERYLKVVEEDVPLWEGAAAARVGQLHQTFAERLYGAPVDPSFEDDPELVDIYRDALQQAAQPYIDSGERAYEHCSKVLQEAGLTSSRWTGECARGEAALSTLRRTGQLPNQN